MRALFLLPLLLALATPTLGQPLFETRAVWFATVLGDGDWPDNTSTDPADKQAADLRDRIRTAKALGLNTFVFQVVSRGDAMYASTQLPWSWRLKAAGQDPGYDPLAVAIDEAHRLGMELHAWFNVFRIGDSATLDRYNGAPGPAHVGYAQPGWVQNVGNDLWLDPALPEVRSWLADNVMEIVENYDIDAIHFDFIRYPQGGFTSDGAAFQFDDRGFDDIDDWRRDHVNLFVSEVAPQVTTAKPWVKVGSAPLGNYQPFDGAWPALWAYNDVYQASRDWLAAGQHDYLAPQIYWDIGSEDNSPDFAYLVDEWVQEAQGQPIFAGIAAYKPDVIAEAATQIDTSRALGAQGQIFFRYDHLLALDLAGRYDTPALPAPMPHRFEATPPSPPTGLLAAQDAPATVTLTWNAAQGSASDPLRAYALFRRAGTPPDPDNAADLLAVVDAATTSFTDAPADPETYYYQVVAQGRLGMLSDPSAAVAAQVITGLPLEVETGPLRFVALYPNPARSTLTLRYVLDRPAAVRWTLYDVLGRVVDQQLAPPLGPGPHETTRTVSDLPPGLYYATLEADGRRLVRRFMVVK